MFLFVLECFIHPMFIAALAMNVVLVVLLVRRANKEG